MGVDTGCKQDYNNEWYQSLLYFPLPIWMNPDLFIYLKNLGRESSVLMNWIKLAILNRMLSHSFK